MALLSDAGDSYPHSMTAPRLVLLIMQWLPSPSWMPAWFVPSRAVRARPPSQPSQDSQD